MEIITEIFLLCHVFERWTRIEHRNCSKYITPHTGHKLQTLELAIFKPFKAHRNSEIQINHAMLYQIFECVDEVHKKLVLSHCLLGVVYAETSDIIIFKVFLCCESCL